MLIFFLRGKYNSIWKVATTIAPVLLNICLRRAVGVHQLYTISNKELGLRTDLLPMNELVRRRK